jgi:hypothetical protein
VGEEGVVALRPGEGGGSEWEVLAASFCTPAPQQVGVERTNMNSTVADVDDVQEYDDLADFSPVDSSSGIFLTYPEGMIDKIW